MLVLWLINAPVCGSMSTVTLQVRFNSFRAHVSHVRMSSFVHKRGSEKNGRTYRQKGWPNTNKVGYIRLEINTTTNSSERVSSWDVCLSVPTQIVAWRNPTHGDLAPAGRNQGFGVASSSLPGAALNSSGEYVLANACTEVQWETLQTRQKWSCYQVLVA